MDNREIEKKIWFTSDTHFGHQKEFLWAPRGFNSIEEHDEMIIRNWNEVVGPNDDVYHLGDVFLGDTTEVINLVHNLNGKIRLAIGNHDTDARLKELSLLSNIEDIQFGYRLKMGKSTFLLTHYPQLTGNYDNSKTYSIHGHTHLPSHFMEGYDLTYNVSCEAQNCTPINIENIKPSILMYRTELDKNN